MCEQARWRYRHIPSDRLQHARLLVEANIGWLNHARCVALGVKNPRKHHQPDAFEIVHGGNAVSIYGTKSVLVAPFKKPLHPPKM